MGKLFLIATLLLLPLPAYGADYTSNVSGGSGDWSNAGSWSPGGGPPGAGDTASIVAGDTIIIDGDVTVGTWPASESTYEVDIAGILAWPHDPGASWTFTSRASIRIQSGGEFRVGTSVSNRLDCSYTARVTLDNTSTSQYYRIKIADGGALNVYGCENYKTSGSAGERARITACSAADFNGRGTTPTIQSVKVVDLSTLRITFSEAVKQVSASNPDDALNPDNYSITGSTLVTVSAVASINSKTVELTVGGQALGGAYTLQVENVEDLSNNAIATG